MRINLLTSFAAGLLIATSISAIGYISDKSDVKASAKTSDTDKTEQVQLSDKEMKNKLESSGYVVLPKAEYDKKVKETKASKEKESSSKEEQSSSKDKQTSSKEEPKPVTKVIVNVSMGMTSIDVGQILVDAKLIPDDAFKFSKDIEKRKLEKELRPGKFEVDSGMSYDQIISTIFVKK